MENVYLLIKYYLQESSKEETQLVSEWLKAREENQETYKDFIRIWFHSEGSGELKKVNPQLAWKKIVAETRISKPKSISIYYRIVSAAAILIVLLFLSIKYTNRPLVAYNETRGNVKEVLLPDSSRVFLNYLSMIEYPSYFSKNSRKVKLSGHAYFEVKKDSKRKFIIETSQAHVKVLGTSFDCFSTDTSTTVFVNTGKVGLVAISDTSEYVILTPGYLGETNRIGATKTFNKDKNILSWKTGIYEFQNTPLPEVLTKLEERYHHSFEYNTEAISDKFITVSLNNDSLKDILEVIQFTCDVSLVFEDNSILVKANSQN